MKEELAIESALFSAGRALDLDEIKDATGLPKPDIRKAARKLMQRYRRKETSLEIVKIGPKYAMQLKTEYGEHARKLAKADVPMKLLKTLALIAFHQPLRQSKLKEMIGDKVYVHVHELRDLKLVRAVRDGRSKLLSTSKLFPEYFGIDAMRKDSIKRFLGKKVGLDEIMEETPGEGDSGEGKEERPTEGTPDHDVPVESPTGDESEVETQEVEGSTEESSAGEIQEVEGSTKESSAGENPEENPEKSPEESGSNQ